MSTRSQLEALKEAASAYNQALEDYINALLEDQPEEEEPAPRKSKKTKAPPPEEEEEEEEPAPRKSKKTKAATTMNDVRDALIELNAEHGKKAVVDVLSRFGVTKVGDLAEDHFDECIELTKNYATGEEEEEEEEEPAPRKSKKRKAPPPEVEEE